MFRWNLTLFLIVLAACATERPPEDNAAKLDAVEAMATRYKASYPTLEEVLAKDLSTSGVGEDTILVDVREPEERAVSRIPGSISKEDFEANPESYKGKRVVAYCTIGYRSGKWAAFQWRQGVDAVNLRGSILAWTHAGGALVDAEGNPTKRVHVYGEEWDLVPEGYESVF
jgi:sodium/bile acid cotransporter 7